MKPFLLLGLVALLGCGPTPVSDPVPPPVARPVVARVPPLPLPTKALARSVVAPVPPTELWLEWDRPNVGETAYHIYLTNGTKLLTVDAAYNNCTVRGLTVGQPYAFYATSVLVGRESEPSNVASAVARPLTNSSALSQQPWVWQYAWPQQRNVTNVLQASTNLTTWKTVAAWKGTNPSPAVVLVTNAAQFYRAGYLNATNVARPVLTQTVAYVRLTWTNAPGGRQRLDREAAAASGSFIAVWTNQTAGTVTLIQPPGRYRVIKL